MSNMKYIDLKYKHINADEQGDVLYVTFSAWNPKGLPRYFGEKFFTSRKIEAYLIAQNGVNHWWHTAEIYQIADMVKQRSLESGKKIILYGASMGAYAACHFRNLFDSEYSIAIAPQIFIDKNIFFLEKRWSEDLDSVQDKMIFNEIESLNSQLNKPLYIFYDPFLKNDSNYVDFYKNNILKSKEIHFLEVPYTNHDVARGLNKARVLSEIVLSFNKKPLIEIEKLKHMCSICYLSDARSFFNYFRKLSSKKNKKDLETFEKFFLQKDDFDFSALYMLAESLVRLERYEEAINISLQSIEVYMQKYSKPAPIYLRNKFKYIVSKSLSI